LAGLVGPDKGHVELGAMVAANDVIGWLLVIGKIIGKKRNA